MKFYSKLWKYVKKSLLKHYDQKLVDDKIIISYSEIIKMVNDYSFIVESEKSCVILCDSQLMEGIAMLTCIYAGVTAIPASVNYGIQHYTNIVETIKPTAIIKNDGKKLYKIKTGLNYAIPPKKTALIMCTSGTSGKPKGVMLSEKNILVNLKSILNYFKITSNDTILIYRSLCHIAVFTGEFLTSIMKGVKVIFYSKRFMPCLIHSIIDKERISVLCGTPSIFELMLRTKHSMPLRVICVSGEPLSLSLANKLANHYQSSEIYHVYGLTEAAPRVSYLPPELFDSHGTSVGKPVRYVSIKILKEDGSRAATGEYGILYIKGKNIMIGYYNDFCLTKLKFHKKWFSTGDIAWIDEFGLLNIKGRKDNMIIRAGLNIYPLDIENRILKDERVNLCRVYSYKDSFDITQIGLNISGKFNDIEDVRNLCKEILYSYEMPRKITIIDKTNLNEFGKIH